MLPRFRFRRKGRALGAGGPAPQSLRSWPGLWENPGRGPGPTWDRGRRDGGVGRNGCHVPGKADVTPGCPLPRTPLLAPAGSCPPALGLPRAAGGCQGHGDAGTGPWWCWDWSVAVLGLVHGGAGGSPMFWSTALKSGVSDWGWSRRVWGGGLCSASGVTPCSAMTPQGRHKRAPWERCSLSHCPSPAGCSKGCNRAQPGLSVTIPQLVHRPRQQRHFQENTPRCFTSM